eukprot:jgi/Chlat1/5012/Chrsp32S04982
MVWTVHCPFPPISTGSRVDVCLWPFLVRVWDGQLRGVMANETRAGERGLQTLFLFVQRHCGVCRQHSCCTTLTTERERLDRQSEWPFEPPTFEATLAVWDVLASKRVLHANAEQFYEFLAIEAHALYGCIDDETVHVWDRATQRHVHAIHLPPAFVARNFISSLEVFDLVLHEGVVFVGIKSGAQRPGPSCERQTSIDVCAAVPQLNPPSTAAPPSV